MMVGYSLAEHGLDVSQIATLVKYVDQRVEKFSHRTDADKQYMIIASKAHSKIDTSDSQVTLFKPLDVLASEEKLEWLVEGWLHSQGFMILTGPPGVGKTQLMLDLEKHLLGGADKFLNRPIPERQLTGLFLSLEMMPLELKYIYEHQIKDESRKDLVYKWNENVYGYAPAEGYDSEVFEGIVKEVKPNVLFVDSLSELFSEDMKEREARLVLKHLMYLRRWYNLAIVMIHHNRKASDGNKKPVRLDDLYGSFLFAKTVEAVICLWENTDGTLELYDVKTRFGKRQKIQLVRSEYLTFNLPDQEQVVEKKPDVPSNNSGGTGSDSSKATAIDIGFG